MTVYIRFCSCQLRAAALLQHLTTTKPEFLELSKKCQSDPRTQGLPLSSFLIKPMQRITKYPLLISKVRIRNLKFPSLGFIKSEFGDLEKCWDNYPILADLGAHKKWPPWQTIPWRSPFESGRTLFFGQRRRQREGEFRKVGITWRVIKSWKPRLPYFQNYFNFQTRMAPNSRSVFRRSLGASDFQFIDQRFGPEEISPLRYTN